MYDVPIYYNTLNRNKKKISFENIVHTCMERSVTFRVIRMRHDRRVYSFDFMNAGNKVIEDGTKHYH